VTFVWQYIVRRLLLMIPTLIGVTVVSFIIIQLSPGDPLLSQAAAKSGQGTQSHAAYLEQKRELGLDKPTLLNFRGFKDYSRPVLAVAHILGQDRRQLVEEFARMADEHGDSRLHTDRTFLDELKIRNFDLRVADADLRENLAEEVLRRVQAWCEDQGTDALAAMIELLQHDATPLPTRRGAVRALNFMLVAPFIYTYSRDPQDDQTNAVVLNWRTWWSQAKDRFEPVSDERHKQLAVQLAELAAQPSRGKIMQGMERFDKSDAPFFVEKLTGDSSLKEKSICALMLRLYLGEPLRADVPDDADAQLIDEASINWLNYYQTGPGRQKPGGGARLAAVLLDTQYARLLSRLVRFDFGRSALKSHEPVGDKIWRAVRVSAPLMVLSEALVYLLAVPLGILCAMYRDTWTDRLVSFVLFALYSVPSFVAAMVLLSLFAYGGVGEWFPLEGLHSDDAETMTWGAYLADYAWHSFLPIVCLSIFSLAGLAMYARTSMLEVLTQDYIRTARSIGVSSPKILFKYALRNGLIPVVTLFADFLPALFGGSVLVEVLFGIPGMGRLLWSSIGQKDYPTLMALVYLDAILMLVSILISDLLYVLVDPRISFDGQEDIAN
jgi:peptide/nickel transport system permease protein